MRGCAVKAQFRGGFSPLVHEDREKEDEGEEHHDQREGVEPGVDDIVVGFQARGDQSQDRGCDDESDGREGLEITFSQSSHRLLKP